MPEERVLYVDRIIDFEDRATYAFVFDMAKVIKNVFAIFNNRDATDVFKAAMADSEGISYMHRFGKFIVYLHIKNDTQSGSIALFDCRNDMDTALDLHLHFTKQGFDKVIKQDFMNQFLELREIYETQLGIVTLTLDPLPLK